MGEPHPDNRELRSRVPAEVSRILARTQHVPEDAIRPDMKLEADLGVDSLATVQIFVGLEEALGFAVPDEELGGTLDIETVEDLVDFVSGQVDHHTESSP